MGKSKGVCYIFMLMSAHRMSSTLTVFDLFTQEYNASFSEILQILAASQRLFIKQFSDYLVIDYSSEGVGGCNFYFVEVYWK